MLLLHGFDQERRTDLCSGTKNRFFVWRTENHSAVNLFRSYEPPTTNLRPRPFLQLTTCILELILCSFEPPTRNPLPRFLRSPDPEQEHFSDKISLSNQITLIYLLFCLIFASWHVSASITSPDALPGITSSRQHHFPGCPSGHHFPTKSASLPAGGSITSDFDATSLRPPTTVLPRTKNRSLLWNQEDALFSER